MFAEALPRHLLACSLPPGWAGQPVGGPPCVLAEPSGLQAQGSGRSAGGVWRSRGVLTDPNDEQCPGGWPNCSYLGSLITRVTRER